MCKCVFVMPYMAVPFSSKMYVGWLFVLFILILNADYVFLHCFMEFLRVNMSSLQHNTTHHLIDELPANKYSMFARRINESIERHTVHTIGS